MKSVPQKVDITKIILLINQIIVNNHDLVMYFVKCIINLTVFQKRQCQINFGKKEKKKKLSYIQFDFVNHNVVINCRSKFS